MKQKITLADKAKEKDDIEKPKQTEKNQSAVNTSSRDERRKSPTVNNIINNTANDTSNSNGSRKRRFADSQGTPYSVSAETGNSSVHTTTRSNPARNRNKKRRNA